MSRRYYIDGLVHVEKVLRELKPKTVTPSYTNALQYIVDVREFLKEEEAAITLLVGAAGYSKI